MAIQRVLNAGSRRPVRSPGLGSRRSPLPHREFPAPLQMGRAHATRLLDRCLALRALRREAQAHRLDHQSDRRAAHPLAPRPRLRAPSDRERSSSSPGLVRLLGERSAIAFGVALDFEATLRRSFGPSVRKARRGSQSGTRNAFGDAPRPRFRVSQGLGSLADGAAAGRIVTRGSLNRLSARSAASAGTSPVSFFQVRRVFFVAWGESLCVRRY